MFLFSSFQNEFNCNSELQDYLYTINSLSKYPLSPLGGSGAYAIYIEKKKNKKTFLARKSHLMNYIPSDRDFFLKEITVICSF